MKKPTVLPSHTGRKSNANILASGSLSIALAARLLDKNTCDGARLFYTWYRHCEEVSSRKQLDCDQTSHGNGVSGRFGRLQAMTYSAIFEKNSVDPAFETIERAVNFHGWPVCVVLDVLSGFRRDVDGQSYKTVSELMAYCYGIAGSVAVGMAEVFGLDVNDPWMMDRACDLGIAFQLTNIACHVMDDAKDGRVYLPADFFIFGAASADFILDSANRSAVIAATNVLLDLANEYYASADLAIAYLPWRIRWVTAAAAGSYRMMANRIRWSDDPWPVKQPVQLWTKMFNLIAICGELVITSLIPLRFNLDRIDLWTRSTFLKGGNWRRGAG